MSLILDALNRSQRERDSANKAPGIETQHTLEPLRQSNIGVKILPWAGLVAALCVIAYLLWQGGEKVEIPASKMLPLTVKAVASREVQPQVAKKLVPVAPQEVSAAVKKVPQEKKVVLAKPTQQKSAVQDLYKNQVDEQMAASTAVKTPPLQVEEPVQKVNTEQTIDIEKMLAAAKSEAKNLTLTEHSAPFLSEISQQFRDKIPTIYYTRHDYSSDSSQSTVTLNGETVQAGAKLAGSLGVEEILSDSVVLNYRGTQFRLRALNSWINL